MTVVINIFYGFYVCTKRTEGANNLSMKFISVTLVEATSFELTNNGMQLKRRILVFFSVCCCDKVFQLFFGQQLGLNAPTWPSALNNKLIAPTSFLYSFKARLSSYSSIFGLLLSVCHFHCFLFSLLLLQTKLIDPNLLMPAARHTMLKNNSSLYVYDSQFASPPHCSGDQKFISAASLTRN